MNYPLSYAQLLKYPLKISWSYCYNLIKWIKLIDASRGTIHPLIPNMAFVGYIESVSNLATAELRCKWLARLADAHFKLPSVTKMLEQINKEIEVMKRTTRFYKRHCISTFSINHSDEIFKEMGESPWRKSNWISEVFSPYSSQDYLLRN